MNTLLYLLLFLGCTYLGHLIYNGRKTRISYSATGLVFTIKYGKRIINVELNEKIRIPSYSRGKGIENIVVPKRFGNVDQVEHFMSRYKTSMLSDVLFRFSDCSRTSIVRFDPVHAKALIDIQIKLKHFIKNN